MDLGELLKRNNEPLIFNTLIRRYKSLKPFTALEQIKLLDYFAVNLDLLGLIGLITQKTPRILLGKKGHHPELMAWCRTVPHGIKDLRAIADSYIEGEHTEAEEYVLRQVMLVYPPDKQLFVTVFLNDVQINANDIGYNDGVDFNRFPAGSEIKEYTVEISKPDFIKQIESNYNTILSEIKKDDQKYADTSDFFYAGYCSLTDLLEKPQSLFEIFKTYLRDGFFSHFAIHQEPKYIINSVDEIIVQDDILIKGRAFKTKI